MNMTEEEVQALVNQGKIRVKNISFPNSETTEGNKGSKYKNKKTMVDGILFDSIFESERYCELKLLEQAGEILDLQLQVAYELIPSFKHNGKLIRKTVYKADFVYTDVRTGKTVVEDTKGYVTKEYALKKKLLLYKYPDIDFKEIRKEK